VIDLHWTIGYWAEEIIMLLIGITLLILICYIWGKLYAGMSRSSTARERRRYCRHPVDRELYVEALDGFEDSKPYICMVCGERFERSRVILPRK